MDNFERFIIENDGADTARLVMARGEWPAPDDPLLGELNAKTLAVNTIECRKKLRKKVAEWIGKTGLVYPSILCAEQCSSSDTARYKAGIAARVISEYVRQKSGKRGRIADLTGGLGVDSLAFSEVTEKVLYNEMNPELAAAARHNFRILGADNIIVSNAEATPDTIKDILGDFEPDIIFLDPARRDSSGKKVFLLEDCSPDVLRMLPGLFEASRFILLKLSPMADITMAAERLDKAYEDFLGETSGSGWNGQWIREIHVVASGGECKELLILMDREWKGEYSLVCREDGKTLAFTRKEAAKAIAAFPESTFARIIFEPGKSLTKAGVSNALCERFGLVKLARFTHLYTIAGPLSDIESEKRTEIFKDFGKVYLVREILPLNKASLRDVGRRYPHSEVSAKNIPMSSEELRKRLKVSSGDDTHIFGARIETPYKEGNYLIVTESRFTNQL